MKITRQRLPPARTVHDAVRAVHGCSLAVDSITQATVPLQSPISLLKWLQAQVPGERLYWADRDGSWEIAVLGFAARRPFSELSVLPMAPGIRWFAGAAFDPSRPPSEEWSPFGRGVLLLPLLAVQRQGDRYSLVAHRLPHSPPIPTPRPMLPHVEAPLAADMPETEPGPHVWQQHVRAAIDAMANGALQKVVLSRRTRVPFPQPPDPFLLLQRLAAKQTDTFSFCFELSEQHAFLGCSPERLFSRSGAQLCTEALAGTRRRGHTPAEDHQLAAELMASPKDREEHHHVVAAIEDVLTPLCTTLEVPSTPEIHRLHRIQHLRTPMTATLRPGTRDAALLHALHPTPAVCGLPSAQARSFIRTHEPFGRGWYAGPVGWFSEERSECAVAIRSALLHGASLWVCAGAGIVPASDPAAEWQELNTKSAQFLSLVEAQ